MRIALFLLLVVLVSGCQSSKSAQPKSSVHNTLLKKNTAIAQRSNYELITQNPWIFIQSQLQIKIPDNKQILAEKDKIITSKNAFESNILRSEPYIYYIVNELNERNMPIELALIPLIESAYDPLATSYAKAAGLWQIVPIAAKQYGLTQNKWYDPRRDLIESTSTAINMLQYLNQRFEGDWLLTLAAYNSGENRVKKAIEWNRSKGLPTNFWALKLPKETMQYVPKFLAITDIIRHNAKYNVSLPNCIYANALVKFDLSKQMSLEQIANSTDISIDELQQYNAGYTKKVVKGPYHLFVPAIYAPTIYNILKADNLVHSDVVDLLQLKSNDIETKFASIDSKLTNNKYVKITDLDINYYEKEHKRYSQITYHVKPGDNLYTIAKHHNVKVDELVKWNKIKSSKKIKPGDKILINIKNLSS